jgi:hypothetical protein
MYLVLCVQLGGRRVVLGGYAQYVPAPLAGSLGGDGGEY